MKPLEKKIILGADGKTMVYVYDGDVDYQPTKTTTNYKYYFDKNGKRWKTRPYNQWTSLVARTKDGSKYKEKASPLSLCKSTSLRQMSIDHDISLKKIIEVDKKQFPNLLTISLIAEKWLEKSNANKTNANIKKLASHNAFLTEILSKINLREFFIEIEKLFNNNRLVVMQKRDNISKNCS